MGIKLSLAEYGLYVIQELKQHDINVQNLNKDSIESKIKEFFDTSNVTKQTDGSPEYLDDTEIQQAISLAKQYAQELKAKKEKPSLTPVKVDKGSEAPVTGDVVAVVCDNGATCQIKGTTITTILNNTQSTREMTEEERKLTTEELIEQLKKENSSKTEIEEQKTQKAQSYEKNSEENSLRRINSGSALGTYNIVEKEDGNYVIDGRIDISSYKNQAYNAYTKGFKNEFGPQVKPDKNGIYHFRKDVARLYDALNMQIQSTAKDIAQKTAIYNDLQARQNDGETLSNAELSFMQDYMGLLQQCGLQMNESGDLEDIPTPKTKRR